MEIMKVKIVGAAPLMMHQDTLANPLHPLTKKMKELTGKKTKTESDYLRIFELEWHAAIYHDDKIGPYIPSRNIDAMILRSARLVRKGPIVERATMCVTDKARVDYNGPRSLDGLWKNQAFRDVRSVVIGKARTMRCRPIFIEWAVAFEVAYDTDQIDEKPLMKIIADAGKKIGILERRPRYGRFSVV